MGQLHRLASEDGLLASEWGDEAPPKDNKLKTADSEDNGDPLSAARGAAWGVMLGSILSAVILWLLM